jgi:hypothetical protein
MLHRTAECGMIAKGFPHSSGSFAIAAIRRRSPVPISRGTKTLEHRSIIHGPFPRCAGTTACVIQSGSSAGRDRTQCSLRALVRDCRCHPRLCRRLSALFLIPPRATASATVPAAPGLRWRLITAWLEVRVLSAPPRSPIQPEIFPGSCN